LTEKVLPKEDSDFSLPGRMDESNTAYFQPELEADFHTIFSIKARLILKFWIMPLLRHWKKEW
jgi:hypothetical protein